MQLLIGSILVLTLVLILTEKTHKTYAAMIGAGLALILAISPNSGPEGGYLIPDIEHLLEILDLDLILVIIGITLMVGVAGKTGLFDYITLVILKKTGNNQIKLLIALSLLTLFFSAVLDAYMAIIIIASITLVGCEALDINPKPLLLAEAIFGDLGGMMTRVASPPNLIIGQHFDIDFITFLLLTFPFVLIATPITLFLWTIIFRKDLSKKISKSQFKEILLIDEKTVITDPKAFRNAAIILFGTILGFVFAPMLPLKIELGYISMAGGFLMAGIVGTNLHEAFTEVEWEMVFFLIGLLTVVGLAERLEILDIIIIPIEFLFSLNPVGGLLSLQWINALASAFLDNVPVASIMASVMDSVLETSPNLSFPALLLSVVIGTNLGGNITPIGSASTVQAISLLRRVKRADASVSFFEFVKFGGFVTLFQLIIGSFYIILLFTFFP